MVNFIKPEKKGVLGYTVTITRYEKGRGPLNKMVRLDPSMVKDLVEGKQVSLKLEDADFLKVTLRKPEDEL